MKKKGFEMGYETLAIVLIAVVVGLVLGSVVKDMLEAATEGTDVERCRLSILTAAKTKKIALGSPLTSAKCKRQELLIKKKDIIGKDDLIDQDKAHKIIADEMAKCWYMVGAGKVDPFSNWKKGSYCFACSQIRFDKALQTYLFQTYNNPRIAQRRGPDGIITSPVPYLMNTKNHPPKRYLVGGEPTLSYWEYFYGLEPRFDSAADYQSLVTEGRKNVLLENSLIMVSMYKVEKKSLIWRIVIAVAAVVVVVGAALLVIVTGGAILILGVSLASIGLLLGGLVAIGVGGAAIILPIYTAYQDCPTCNAIGGIALFPDIFDFSMEIKMKIGGDEEELPVCSILVN